MEKVKAIEPDFYSVNSVLSKNKALCVSVFHSIFRKPILFYYKKCLALQIFVGMTQKVQRKAEK